MQVNFDAHRVLHSTWDGIPAARAGPTRSHHADADHRHDPACADGACAVAP